MKYLIAFSFLFSTLASSGQQDSTINVSIGSAFHYHFAEMNDFSNILRENNFSPIENSAVFFNFYMKSASPRTNWESTFGFTYYQRNSGSASATNQANIIGYGVSTGFEYKLVDTKYFFLNPAFGFNLEYYKIGFSENVANNDIGSILSSQAKTYSATSFQVPLLVGLNTGIKIPYKEGSINFILTGGYKLHFDNTGWNLNDVQSLDSSIDLSSPYAGVGLEFDF